jgi:TetR/AcrR family transcriptional regulator
MFAAGMSTADQPRRSGAHTRELILDAAEQLFATKGYRGTSLEEIGREAQLSRGTPGYFFGSKHRLYGEVLARILTRAQLALEPAYERSRGRDRDDEARLRELVAAHLELLVSEPSLVRLIQWETLNDDARIVVELGSRTGPLVQLIQDLSSRLGPARIDTDHATDLLMGIAALCWFPLAYAEPLERAVGRDLRNAEAIEATTQNIVEFVLARIGAEPGLADSGVAPAEGTVSGR